MEAVVWQWFAKNRNHVNSMRTTELLKFDEGEMQVKWFKLRGHIIVQQIELEESCRGFGLFTDFCNVMLQWPEVTDVQLQSICTLTSTLIEKLKAKGWKNPPNIAEYHDLFLTLQ